MWCFHVLVTIVVASHVINTHYLYCSANMPFLERCVEQHRYGQARIRGHYLSREDDVAGMLLHLHFTKQQDSAVPVCRPPSTQLRIALFQTSEKSLCTTRCWHFCAPFCLSLHFLQITLLQLFLYQGNLHGLF